jgi:hypothetical protein
MAKVNLAAKLDVRAMSADFDALIRSLDEKNATPVILGTVLGRVMSLAISNNPQDPSSPAVALVGEFEGIPADASVAPVRAGRAFIQPKHVHDAIVKQCLGGAKLPVDKMPERGRPVMVPIDGVMEFHCEVGVKFAKSTVGYTYTGEVDMPDDAVDPFAALKGKLGIPTGARLAAPRKQAALPSPSKKKRR